MMPGMVLTTSRKNDKATCFKISVLSLTRKDSEGFCRVMIGLTARRGLHRDIGLGFGDTANLVRV